MTENSYDLSRRSQQTLNCTQAGAHTPCCQVLTELQNSRENTWEAFNIASSLQVKGGKWCLPCLLYILPIWDDFLKLVIQLSKWGGEGNKTISSQSQGLIKPGRLLFHLFWLSAISQCSWCVHMCTIPLMLRMLQREFLLFLPLFPFFSFLPSFLLLFSLPCSFLLSILFILLSTNI